VPPSPPVPPGKIRLCIAGFHISPHTGRARKIASLIARKFPDQYETWYVWGSSSEYESFIIERTRDVPFPPELKGHGSSPFVYLEQGASKTTTPIGGREQLAQWVLKNFTDQEIVALASEWKIGDTCHDACCCKLTEPEYQPTCGQQSSPLIGGAKPNSLTAPMM